MSLSPISVPLEAEPELQDVVGELASESMPPRTLPFAVHYLECYVLRWGGKG